MSIFDYVTERERDREKISSVDDHVFESRERKGRIPLSRRSPKPRRNRLESSGEVSVSSDPEREPSRLTRDRAMFCASGGATAHEERTLPRPSRGRRWSWWSVEPRLAFLREFFLKNGGFVHPDRCHIELRGGRASKVSPRRGRATGHAPRCCDGRDSRRPLSLDPGCLQRDTR